MQTPAHAIAVPRQTQGRVTGILLAALLQAGVIWVMVEGLDIKVWPRPVPPPLQVTIPKIVKHIELPPEGPMVEPQMDHVIAPTVIIDTGEKPPPGLTLNSDPPPPAGAAGHGPVAVMATHSIPPYPPLEARLGHEGTVVLRLTISAQGLVTEAVVVRSSGSEGLDAAARAWVVAHWRYQPAFRGGVAVPSTGNVAVEFKIRNAG